MILLLTITLPAFGQTLTGIVRLGADGDPEGNVLINTGESIVYTASDGTYAVSVTAGTTISLRAVYAQFVVLEKTLTIVEGTNYMNFWFDPPAGRPFDFDNNFYETVEIGDQTWIAENLKATHFLDGSAIPNVLDHEAWFNLTTPGYCWHDNDPDTYKDEYGALYNWYTVNTEDICPIGWHVPSDNEWKTVEIFLGMTPEEADGRNYRGTDQGTQLKSTTHWADGKAGTDLYEFSALPGGDRRAEPVVLEFYGLNNIGTWWTSTEYDGSSAWFRFLHYDMEEVYREPPEKDFGFSIRCVSDNLPTINTAVVTNITENSAVSGGYDLDDCGTSILEKGICWSTSPNPTTDDNTTDDGTGIETFTSTLTSLQANTTYNVRAYATNSIGTSYGDEVSFTTYAVTDNDGNYYNSVTIGDQLWMAENLKTTKYNDNTDITLVTDQNTWNNLTTPGYCWYNNNQATYGNTYGALYNWYTVETGKLCPASWHVPSDEELKQLEMYLGMSQSEADKTSVRGTDEGGKLKETGLTHWNTPNAEATNESGFTALPGGRRYYKSSFTFMNIGDKAGWWSATWNSTTNAWSRSIVTGRGEVARGVSDAREGKSVRCLQHEIYVVKNTNDAGPGSLRKAIIDANTNPGNDEIVFDISTGTFTIQPLSPLPEITDPVIIDGYTQAGSQANTNPPTHPDGMNSVLLIEIDGSNAGVEPGLRITAGNCTVRGLVFNGFEGIGIALRTKGGNMLKGNYVGTNTSGTASVGFGNGEYGIEISGSNDNRISQNIVSGNGADSGSGLYSGIIMNNGSTGNQISVNYIGTNAAGTGALGNHWTGVEISGGASRNTIGSGNLISGNGFTGVSIIGASSSGNQVLNNLIGSNALGNVLISNADDCVQIADAPDNEISGNVLVGAGRAPYPVGNNGIEILGSSANGNTITGNYIGTNANNTTGLGNGFNGIQIKRDAHDNTIGPNNVISGNLADGILIETDAFTGETSADNNIVIGNLIGTSVNG
ncbi:MAG: hypothetical protein DRI98_14250, partial [Bacteroidetes bacterium]